MKPRRYMNLLSFLLGIILAGGYIFLQDFLPAQAAELKSVILSAYALSAVAGWLWFSFPLVGSILVSVVVFTYTLKTGLDTEVAVLALVPLGLTLILNVLTTSELSIRVIFLREWSWRQVLLIPVDFICIVALILASLGYFSFWGLYQKSLQVNKGRKQTVAQRIAFLKSDQSLRVFGPGSKEPMVFQTARTDWSEFYNLKQAAFFKMPIVQGIFFSEGDIRFPMKSYEAHNEVGRVEQYMWKHLPKSLGRYACRPFSLKGLINLVLSKGKRGGSNPTLQLAKNFWSLRRDFRTDLRGIRRNILKAQVKFLEEFPLAMHLCHRYSAELVSKLYFVTLASGHGDLYGVHRLAYRYFGKKPEDVTMAEAQVLAAAIPNPFRRKPSNFHKKQGKGWFFIALHLSKRYARIFGEVKPRLALVEGKPFRLYPGDWSKLVGATQQNYPVRFHLSKLVKSDLRGEQSNDLQVGALRSISLTMPLPLLSRLNGSIRKLNARFTQSGVGATVHIVRQEQSRSPLAGQFAQHWKTLFSFGARYIGKGKQRRVNDFSSDSATSGSTMKIPLFLLARAVWGKKLDKLILPNQVWVRRPQSRLLKAQIPYALTRHGYLFIGNSHRMQRYMTTTQAIARSANVSSVLLLTQLLWGARLVKGGKLTELGKYTLGLYIEELKRRYTKMSQYDKGRFSKWIATAHQKPEALLGLLKSFGSPKYRKTILVDGWKEKAQAECQKVDKLGFLLSMKTKDIDREIIGDWFFEQGKSLDDIPTYGASLKEALGQYRVTEMRSIFCIKPFRQYLSVLLFRDFLIKLGIHRFSSRVKGLAPVPGLTLGAGLNVRTSDLMTIPMSIASRRMSHKVRSWTSAITDKTRITPTAVFKRYTSKLKLDWEGGFSFVRSAMHQTLFGEKGTARRAGKLLVKAKLCTADTPHVCGAKTGTMQAYRGVACIMHVGQYAGVIRVYHARNKSLIRRGFEYSRLRCSGRGRRRRCTTRVRRKKFSSSDACYHLADALAQVAKYCTSNKVHCQ